MTELCKAYFEMYDSLTTNTEKIKFVKEFIRTYEKNSDHDCFLIKLSQSSDIPRVKELIQTFYIKDNEKLISHCINKYYPTYTNYYEELMQAGREGIFRALLHYDADSDTKLSTFFSFWIKGEIVHYISKDVHKQSSHYGATMAKINRAKEVLKSKGNLNPSVKEIAFESGVKPVTVFNALNGESISNSISLTALASEPDKHTSPLSTEKQVEQDAEMCVLREAVHNLPDIQAKILIMSFGLFGHPKKSDTEIATFFDTTPFLIKKNKKDAINQLRFNTSMVNQFADRIGRNKVLECEIIGNMPVDAVLDEITCIIDAELSDLEVEGIEFVEITDLSEIS